MPSPQEHKERVSTLDWVKGALVVFMVVYHSINYSGFRGAAFRFMAFLPPSFIMIAGLVLTNIYLARYQATDWRLHRRLLVRGLKLVLVYTVLNIGIVLLHSAAEGHTFGPLIELAKRWQEVYFDPSDRVTSSSILLSIAYLLILAPVILVLHSLKSWVLPVLVAVWSLAYCFFEWNHNLNYHFQMVTFGIFGMYLGTIPLQRLETFAQSWKFILPAYVAYRICGYFFTEIYPVQLAGTVLSLSILFGLALTFSEERFLYRQCVLLGRYTLFGYIFQLLVLQVLRELLPIAEPIVYFTIMMLITLVLTWFGTVVIEKLRQNLRVLDMTYKLVFS